MSSVHDCIPTATYRQQEQHRANILGIFSQNSIKKYNLSFLNKKQQISTQRKKTLVRGNWGIRLTLDCTTQLTSSCLSWNNSVSRFHNLQNKHHNSPWIEMLGLCRRISSDIKTKIFMKEKIVYKQKPSTSSSKVRNNMMDPVVFEMSLKTSSPHRPIEAAKMFQENAKGHLTQFQYSPSLPSSHQGWTQNRVSSYIPFPIHLVSAWNRLLEVSHSQNKDYIAPN